MNRRDLIQWMYSGCIAAVALPCGIEESAARSPSVTAVIFDRRYPESVQLASTLVGFGAQPFDADSDIVRLWRGPLRRIAAGDGARIAGLLSYPDFLMSRGSAAELRLPLLSHGVHGVRSGLLVHTLRGRRGGAFCAGGADWAATLAKDLAAVGASDRQAADVVIRTDHPCRFRGTLYSWIVGGRPSDC